MEFIKLKSKERDLIRELSNIKSIKIIESN